MQQTLNHLTMGTRSGKSKILYEQFKKEITVLNLKSKETGKLKKVIRWRGHIYETGSITQAFAKARIHMKLEK
jgi:hypothetical protein